MSYLVFAFLASVLFAISSLISKFASKHTIDNKDSMMAYFLISCFTFAGFLYPIVSKEMISVAALKPLIIAVVTFLIGYYLFYWGIYETDASSFAPLFQLQAGLIGVWAFLFLGERFPIKNYLWLALIIGGAVLVSLDEKMSIKSFFHKGILLILVMQLLHSLSNLFIGFTLKEIDFIQIMFWESIIIGGFGLVFYWWRRPKLNYPLGSLVPLFIAGWFSNAGAVFLFRAFSENLTISSVISLLMAPIVFVVSWLASKFYPQLLEHHPAKVYLVRGLGLMVILLGVYKIAGG